jgi:hypothetical protein
MEFMSRGGGRGNEQPQTNTSAAGHTGRRKHIDWATRTVRIELFIVLLGSALLLAAVSLYMAMSSPLGSEARRVNNTKYQAVFLNGGATSGAVAYTTYFGKVSSINDKYMVLKDVYYLTTEQSSDKKTTSPQLTKLGCQQLHSPYDEMVINRNQVAFWENLKDDGKVVQAIKQYKQQNPNGPDCTTQPTSTGSSSSTTNTQNSTTNQGQ